MDKLKRQPATRAFSSCPACGEKQLIELDTDLICCSCDWDSCLYSVASGHMDNFMEAIRRLEEPSRLFVRPAKSKSHWQEDSANLLRELPDHKDECA